MGKRWFGSGGGKEGEGGERGYCSGPAWGPDRRNEMKLMNGTMPGQARFELMLSTLLLKEIN